MIRFSLACLLLSQLPPLYPQIAKWQPVETATHHWSENSRPYTFIVQQAEANRSEEAARLRINTPDGRALIVIHPGGLIKMQNKKLAADNLIESS